MYIKTYSKFNRGLIFILNPVSLLYKSLSFLVLKKRSLKKKNYDNAYIISIDNLSFGGTGKTALVIAMGKYLSQKKIKFAIITRGYRSRSEQKGALVTAQNKVDEVGDEAILLKSNFPDQDIYVGKNRHKSLKQARSRNNKIMLLDDGFQSTSIPKNLKIMLINPHHPYYYLRHFKCLMRGEDIILRYHPESGSALKSNHRLSVQHSLPMEASYSFIPEGFYNPQHQSLEINDAPIMGFSALGDNIRFQTDLSAFNLKAFKAYRDHFHFTQKNIKQLDRLRQNSKATYLVCTEKDFIKLAHLDLAGIPLIYIKNRLQLSVDILSVIYNHAKKQGFI